MKVNKVYLEASFVSFMIHASIILYSLGFFYYESNQRSVLSKPINVNLIFQEEVQKTIQSSQPQKKVIEASVLTPPPSIDKIYFLSTFYILTVGYLTIRLV